MAGPAIGVIFFAWHRFSIHAIDSSKLNSTVCAFIVFGLRPKVAPWRKHAVRRLQRPLLLQKEAITLGKWYVKGMSVFFCTWNCVLCCFQRLEAQNIVVHGLLFRRSAGSAPAINDENYPEYNVRRRNITPHPLPSPSPPRRYHPDIESMPEGPSVVPRRMALTQITSPNDGDVSPTKGLSES